MAIPRLENTRILGGLHPLEVLVLMDILKRMWLLPLVLAVLYALSFALSPLNTAEAIVGTSLCSSAILGLVLILALVTISMSL